VSKLLGAKELSAALTELGDFTSKDAKSVMRASVRVPMGKVMKTARGNISKFSPGKTLMHRTYRGRLVGAGFAARNLRIIVKINDAGTSVTAVLGVRAEAFYAVQFFEKGTAKIPRQPFLVPALETSKETAVNDVGSAYQRRILQIARRYARLNPARAA
jgi:HK97 gp10 family phage protein